MYSFSVFVCALRRIGGGLQGYEAGNLCLQRRRTKLLRVGVPHQIRVANKYGEHYTDAVSKIVDGLRGDAFTVAQEVGLGNSCMPDGVDQLLQGDARDCLPSYDPRGEGTVSSVHQT
ncbi:hypothetical protein N9L68_05390 [bacterium]|nr:hypothetical protein [bacterium]